MYVCICTCTCVSVCVHAAFYITYFTENMKLVKAVLCAGLYPNVANITPGKRFISPPSLSPSLLIMSSYSTYLIPILLLSFQLFSSTSYFYPPLPSHSYSTLLLLLLVLLLLFPSHSYPPPLPPPPPPPPPLSLIPILFLLIPILTFRTAKLYTQQDGKVKFHPKSVNYGVPSFSSKFLIYHTKVIMSIL